MSDGDKLVEIERQIESLAKVFESLQLKVERICIQGTDDNQALNQEADCATASKTHSRQHFGPTVITDFSAAEIQRDFERIRDTLNRVPVPTSLKVNDSTSGIKQECRDVLKTVSKCARYTETGIKIIS